MDVDFSVEQAVKKRYSVRNYGDQEVDVEKIEKIKSFVSRLNNPFNKKVIFHKFLWHRNPLPLGGGRSAMLLSSLEFQYIF